MSEKSLQPVTESAGRRVGIAWLLLTLMLGAHVADEALTGFLDVYNPVAREIRSVLPLLPLPTFTFGVWISGLLLAVTGLLLITPYAFRKARWVAPVSLAFGCLMLVNALIHLGGSALAGRPLPGIVSSPFLAAASLFLLWTVRTWGRE